MPSNRIVGVPPLDMDGANFNLDSDGPRLEEVLRELPEQHVETREQLTLLDEAVRIAQDDYIGAKAATASALEDRDAAKVHLANLQRAATDPNSGVTSEQLAAARSALERANARHAAAMQKEVEALSRLTAAKAARARVYRHVLAALRKQASDGTGSLMFFDDVEGSAAAGSLALMTKKPSPPTKKILELFGLSKGETEFADPNRAIRDCRVEANRLRSERKGVEAEHEPVDEIRRQATIKVETLARTTAVRVHVDKDGVDLVFPKRPTGVTAPNGERLQAVDVEGLMAHYFRDQILADVDRSISDQFDGSPGMTRAEKRKELTRIDAEILAVERVEAAAGWQLARAGEPAGFRADLDPRAILGLV